MNNLAIAMASLSGLVSKGIPGLDNIAKPFRIEDLQSKITCLVNPRQPVAA